MEKMLITDNRHKADQKIMLALIQARKINEELLPEFKALGLKPDLELIKDALSGCKITREKFEKKLEDDLVKFSLPGIRERYQQDADLIFYEFKKKADKCNGLAHFHTFSLDKGKVVVSEGQKQKIRDAEKYYITGKDELELYAKHQAAAQALNDFLVEKHRASFPNFFTIDEGKIKASPRINYELLTGTLEKNLNLKGK